MEKTKENKEGLAEAGDLESEDESKRTLLTKPLNEDRIKTELNKDEKPALSYKERLKLIKENVTVEPIMACYVMPSILASIAIQNLNLEKACRVNLNISSDICDALTLRQTENYTIYEEEVQRLVASMQVWKNIIQTAIPLMLILFVGAWSDKTGRRKICILIPIVGELLSCLGFIINTYFFYEWPVEVAVLTETIFPAITGGWFTNFIGVFSYIGDITTTETRTYRVGMVNIFMSMGYPAGSALSGILLKHFGYYTVFSISSMMYMFSLIYGYYYLEDPNPKKLVKRKNTNACSNFLRDFFDFQLVLKTFEVVFKRGAGNKRLRVSLLLIVVCVIYGPMHGEYTIFYLFTRFRFNWDEVQYSVWSTYAMLTNLAGTFFSISLFTNYLKLDDTMLGIISCTSKIVASFSYAFARNNLEIYLAPLLEILNGTSFIAMRSIATKLVSGDEFGKMNSLFGLAEATMPLVYGPLYSRTYIATLNILPGAVFLLGAALTLPAIGIFGWLYMEHKKDANIKESTKMDTEKQLAT